MQMLLEGGAMAPADNGMTFKSLAAPERLIPSPKLAGPVVL